MANDPEDLGWNDLGPEGPSPADPGLPPVVGPGTVRPIPPHPSGPPAAPAADGGLLPMLSVLVLLGAVGASVFMNFAKAKLPAAPAASAAAPAEEPTSPAGTPAPSAEPASMAGTDDLKAAKEQIDDLSKRLDQLQGRVASIPAPAPPPDVKAIEDQVARLLKDNESLSELPARLSVLDEQFAALTKKVDTIQGTAASTEPRTGEPALASAANPGGTANTDVDVADTALSEGVEVFNKGQYAEAREIFEKLQQSNPDDARVWYYSALTSGFVTRNWRGETERLVNKGIDLEKAGKPDKAAIDAAFGALSASNGKAWLAGYRGRVGR